MADVLSREQIEEARSNFDKNTWWGRLMTNICDMALSALDNAEDAERYRFLKKHLHEPHAAAHFAAFCNWHPDDKQKLLSLDAAIDAARKESHESRTPRVTFSCKMHAVEQAKGEAHCPYCEAADLRVHLSVSERDLAYAVKEVVDLRERLAKARVEAIEECAKKADEFMDPEYVHNIVAAIRALKQKGADHE